MVKWIFKLSTYFIVERMCYVANGVTIENANFFRKPISKFNVLSKWESWYFISFIWACDYITPNAIKRTQMNPFGIV